MVADAAQTLPGANALPAAPDRDRQRAWFALALPALMALLLALVPLVGRAAAGPFALVLLPLVIWSAFRDTERAIYVYIAWCWMDGTIRGVFGGGPVTIVARDIVLGIIVVGWGAQRLQTRFQDPMRWPPGSLVIALFTINCLMQVFNPYSLGIVQSIGGLKLHLSPIPLFFVAYDVLRRPGQVRALFLFLTLATLVIGLVSFVQYIEGQSWTWAHFPGTKDAISQSVHATQAGTTLSETASFKPPGTTAFGGGVAAYVSIVFPLTFGLLMLSHKNKPILWIKAFLLGILMSFVVILLINGLRSALVSAVVAVLIGGVLIGGRLRARMFVSIGICFVLGLFALGFSQSISEGGVTDRFSSTFSNPVKAMHEDRRTFLDDISTVVTVSPVGLGLGRMLAGSGRLGSADNSLGFAVYSESYLGEIIYETGILGGLFISIVAVTFLVRGIRVLTWLDDANNRFLITVLIGSLAVLVAGFFVAPVLIGPPGSVMFWLMGGMLLRVFGMSAATMAWLNQEAQ